MLPPFLDFSGEQPQRDNLDTYKQNAETPICVY